MKWLGTKRIAIKSIVLPGNFSATRAAPRIQDLATSVREHGVIQPPVVEKSTMRLVAGHDRVAAVLALKEKHVEVRFVECDAREFRRMQIAENLHRRSDDRDALIAEYARSEEAAIIESQRVEAGTDVPTSEQSVKKEANERTAKKLGVTVERVKKAKKREAAKEKAAAEPPPAEPELTEEIAGGKLELPPKFNTFDLDLPLASRSVIAETATWLGDWAQTINGLLRELTELDKQGTYAVAPAHIQKIRDAFQGAGHAVREAIPASLCFYCKAQPSATPNCSACGGTGVVGRHGGDNVPPEAKLVGDKARCAVGGKWVLVGAAANAAEAAPPAPAKKARSIRVTDEHGQEIPLDDDEPAFA